MILSPSSSGSIDRESLESPVLTLTLVARDGEGLEGMATYLVTILDQNDNTPTFINGTYFNITIREDAEVRVGVVWVLWGGVGVIWGVMLCVWLVSILTWLNGYPPTRVYTHTYLFNQDQVDLGMCCVHEGHAVTIMKLLIYISDVTKIIFKYSQLV